MAIERARGISVVTSVMTFEYGGTRLQPARHAGPRGLLRPHLSHADRRRLRAVMVIDAAKGIEARTRKLFEVCRLRDIPIITFINKMDRESARAARAARRDREDAGARHRADGVADRPGPRLPRHLRSHHAAHPPDRQGRRRPGRLRAGRSVDRRAAGAERRRALARGDRASSRRPAASSISKPSGRAR